MQIEYEDFCLRSICKNDAESYYEIYSHPDVAKFDDYTPITREELKIDMARIALYTSASAFLELAVAIRPKDKMIGVLTLDRKNGYCYLGYHFHPSYHGRGYAVRSLIALLEHLSPDQRETMRIVSHPNNCASITLAKKLGFVHIERRRVNGNVEEVYKFDAELWHEKRETDLFKSYARKLDNSLLPA